MKVDGPRSIDGSRAVRGRAAGAATGGFALESMSETRASSAASGVASLSSVNALIALQELPDARSGRAKAVRRGRDMLDVLDELRDGLLTGSISRSSVQRLVTLTNAEREDFMDPGLAAVMDEIELRAKVELAKLDFAGAN
ncbi:MAG: flagellar assembly protein FliX [Alphaproteobacteria bacterium]|nr:flagellar assembly protein FliX [Alphaproteobacteria bacterium]